MEAAVFERAAVFGLEAPLREPEAALGLDFEPELLDELRLRCAPPLAFDLLLAISQALSAEEFRSLLASYP